MVRPRDASASIDLFFVGNKMKTDAPQERPLMPVSLVSSRLGDWLSPRTCDGQREPGTLNVDEQG